jgi:uncharacterized protein YndB with AHSA1/START domain
MTMENPKMAEEIVLELRRTYPTPRERVFRAWTDPEQVKKWFGPKGCTCPEAELDLRVGGRYRFVLEEPDGRHIVAGEYVEISAPERLVFTWKWEHVPQDSPETLVTVEFLPKGDGTEMVLTHERFPAEDLRDLHNQGWASSLECLDELLAG